jgi:hypothetical protein
MEIVPQAWQSLRASRFHIVELMVWYVAYLLVTYSYVRGEFSGIHI